MKKMNKNTYDNSQVSFLGAIWCIFIAVFFTLLPFRSWFLKQFDRVFVAKEVTGDDQQS
jgi:hypothetical protein